MAGGRLLAGLVSIRKVTVLITGIALVASSFPVGALPVAHAFTPPTLVVDAAINIGKTTASITGTTTDNGGAAIISQGVKYGTTTGATEEDYSGDSNNGPVESTTFTQALSGLTCETTYYYRAYAINNGLEHGLSTEGTFTTSSCVDPVAPSVTTSAPTGITKTGIGNIIFEVTDPGSAEIDSVGVEFGTTTNYGTTAWTSTPGENTIFGINFGGLTCNTTYHVRGYAISSAGTGYGNDQQFTTAACAITYRTQTLPYTLLDSGYWNKVAISDDGERILAVPSYQGNIIVSRNGGVSFATSTELTNVGTWAVKDYYAAGMSPDGSTMAAGGPNDYTYISQDGGINWFRSKGGYWNDYALSTNGQKIFGANYAGNSALEKSTDSGTNWSDTAGTDEPYYPSFIAYSADGSTLAVAEQPNEPAPIKISGDDGATWTETNSGSHGFVSVDVSANGNTIVAVDYSENGTFYYSHNRGVSWTTHNFNTNMKSALVSSDGSTMLAVGASVTYASGDGGATWTQIASSGGTHGAMSSDGAHFVVAGGQLMIGTLDVTAPTVTITRPASVSRSWDPSVSWGDSTVCEYSLNGTSYTTLDCSNNGADIPAPESTGSNGLYVRGTDSVGNQTVTTISYTYQPYGPIYNCADLIAVNEDLDASYTLMNEIDCTADGDAATIGSTTTNTFFSGTFDGNSHSITFDHELTGGLFGGLSAATVKDLRLYGTSSAAWAGGLANLGGGATVQRVGSYVTVYASDYAGGLFGDAASESVIEDSFSRGDVTSGGSHVGGLVGALDHSTITRSYASGAVTGGSNVGGLVGLLYNVDAGAISDSFTTSEVFAGWGSQGAVTGSSYNTPSPSPFSNVYFDSNVNSEMPCLGDASVSACTGVLGGVGSSHFYDKTQAPLDTWNFNLVWQDHVDQLPTLQIYNVPPTVTTHPATSVTETSATLNGSIDYVGENTITRDGFEYDFNEGYGFTASSTSGSVVGSTTESVSDLACSTEYHYRAYAEGEFGTVYGDMATFTTSNCSPPTLVSTTPEDGETGVSLLPTITLEFSAPVSAGVGNILIRESYGSETLIETIPADSSAVTGTSTTEITIQPSVSLNRNTIYSVMIDDTAFYGPGEQYFAGIAETDYEFTTTNVFSAVQSGVWNLGTTWSNAPGACSSSCVEGVDYPGAENDANTGAYTVTLNNTQAVDTLTIPADGTLDMSGEELTVHGSLINQGTLDAGPGSLMHFHSTHTDNTIELGADTGSFYNVLFDSVSGVWTLVDNNLYAAGSVQVNEGTLDLNGNNLVADTFTVNSKLELFGNESVTTPTLGEDSTVTYTAGAGSYSINEWDYGTLKINSSNRIFGTATTIRDGSNNAVRGPRALVTADFDGVNGPDIATGDRSTGRVSILLRQSDGSFSISATYTVGNSPHSLVAGDFNGDGHPDIAGVSRFNSYMFVLLNNGDGTFQSAVTYSTGNYPAGITSGDWNDDSFLDLAVVNATGNTVKLFLNDVGTPGTFTREDVSLDGVSGSGMFAIASGDLNDDGYTDIVTTNIEEDEVEVLLNDSGDVGTFLPQGTTYGTAPKPQSIEVADVTDDGFLDVIVATADSIDDGTDNGSVSIFVGNGEGGLAVADVYEVGRFPHGLAVQDFNGDDIPDIAFGNGDDDNMGLLVGAGSGSFILGATYSAGERPMDVAAADFDSDGHYDIAVANRYDDSLSVFMNTGENNVGNAIFEYTGSQPLSVGRNFINTRGSVLSLESLEIGGSFINSDTFTFLGGGDVAFSATSGSNYQVRTNGAYLGNVSFANSQETDVQWALADDIRVFGTISIGPATTLALNGHEVSEGSIVNDGTLSLYGDEYVAAVPTTTSNSLVKFTAPSGEYVLPNWDYNGSIEIGATHGFGAAGGARYNTYTVENSPRNVALADLDNDSYQDAVVTNQNQNSISVLLSNGSGGFQEQVTYDTGQMPHGVALADINNDDLIDIVVTNRESSTVSVYLNDDGAPGSFVSAVTYEVGARPTGVVITDLNQDGDVDLAVTNMSSDSVSVLIGDGAGSFEEGTTVSVGRGPWGIQSADFNKDDAQDLVVVNSSEYGDGSGSPGNTVSILLGDGNGGFEDPSILYDTDSQPHFVTVGDFNDDTYPDFALTNQDSDTVSVYLNHATGDGTFDEPITYEVGNSPVGIASADVNDDSVIDLVISHIFDNTLGLLIGSGDGTFADEILYGAGHNPFGVAIGDVTGDGAPDLVTVDRSNSEMVVLPHLSGTIEPYSGREYPVGSRPRNIAAGDFDGNEINDLVLSNMDDNTVSIIMNPGLPFGGRTYTYEVGESPFGVTVNDWNQDTIPDIAVANRSGSVSVLYGAEDQSEGPIFDVENVDIDGNTPNGIVSGDWNQDGLYDLAVADKGSNSVRILMGSSEGFTYTDSFNTGGEPWGITTGDWNGDGNPDLATADASDNTFSVLLGDGEGGFTLTNTYSVGNYPHYLDTGDFDDDGIADMAVGNFSDSTVSIYLGLGDGSFVEADVPTLDTDPDGLPNGLVVEDFNRDGEADIAVANSDGDNGNPDDPSTISIFYGTGDGAFMDRSDAYVGYWPFGIVATDLDHDGYLDIAAARRDDDSASFILNSGGSSEYGMSGSIAAGGNVTISSGTLDLGEAVLSVHGDFTNRGTLTANVGTVELTGTNQTISGSSTFYNLTKQGDGADTLSFEAGSTQTVTNELTLLGDMEGGLDLVSTESGEQWNIRPTGEYTLDYLTVSDSNNTSEDPIQCTDHCVSGGNNTNWFFWGVDITATSTAESDATVSWTTSHPGTAVIQYGLTTDYSHDVSDETFTTEHEVSIPNLIACVTYHYKVLTTDIDDDTVESEDGTLTTDGCAGNAPVERQTARTVTTGGGGTATLLSSGTGVTVVVPAGFAATDAELQVKKLVKSVALGALSTPSSASSVGDYVYDFKAMEDPFSPITSFLEPITVTIHYSDEDLVDVAESDLVIYRNDDGVWTELSSCTIDHAENTVTCTTDHFSTFGLFAYIDDPAPAPSSGGGRRGGGGGFYNAASSGLATIELLRSKLAMLIAQLTGITGGTAAAALGGVGGASDPFPRNLKMGSSGEDVRRLQKFLNTHGYSVATTGTGSLGKESTLFGAATKNALIQYQEAHPAEILVPQQLTAGTGNFFNYTRNYVNGIVLSGG